MERAYRLALMCGLLPLVVGVGTFLLWLPTRWKPLMGVGIVTIWVGLGLFLVGGITLIWFLAQARAADPRPTHLGRRVRLATILLGMNLPLAALIVSAVVAIETRDSVQFYNGSSLPIDRIELHGPGVERTVGPLPSGQDLKESFWFDPDGEFSCVVHSGGVTRGHIISGYISGGLGLAFAVTIQADGSISSSEITHQPR